MSKIKKLVLVQSTVIAVVTAAAVCVTDDCFLCIAVGEVEVISQSWCNDVEYNDEQTTLDECWVSSSREAAPWESGRTGITNNNPGCSVGLSITHVVLNADNDCVREDAMLPPEAYILTRNCPKFIPDPNSPACTAPSGS